MKSPPPAIFYLLLVAAPAAAEAPLSEPAAPLAAWVATADDRGCELWVSSTEPASARGDLTVRLTATARVGDTVLRGQADPALLDRAASAPLVVAIPAELASVPFAADYVVNLTVTALVGGVPTPLPVAWLAYVDGTSAPPRIWNREQLDREAPNGVLSDELRALALAHGLEGFLRPTPTATAERPIPIEGTDTGVEVAP